MIVSCFKLPQSSRHWQMRHPEGEKAVLKDRGGHKWVWWRRKEGEEKKRLLN